MHKFLKRKIRTICLQITHLLIQTIKGKSIKQSLELEMVFISAIKYKLNLQKGNEYFILVLKT